MRFGSRHLAFVIGPPLLSVGLLAGIVAEQRTHLKPQDVEPYHARAAAAIGEIPYIMGTWTGEDKKVPLAAQKLLRPNVILSRAYVDSSPSQASHVARSASLLVVQCRDSRDMVGHYPPICYRAQGKTQDEKYSGPRDWQVGGKTISGYEYQFTEVWHGQTFRTTVYNFLIVPGRGIVRDMKGVEEAAEDYQQRHYGAAQFQVVFGGLASADRSREERDEMFAALIGPNLKVLETLTSGGLK
ncbi:MAG TPA: hypothetical protein VER17_20610 [Tepidisphaeraceae bacterium]|nr:hypothetical protein [Tepidisphaeraceae bacterium]